MRRTIFVAGSMAIVVALGAVAMHRPSVPPVAPIARAAGPAVHTVLATGSLQALETVKVGSQTSGLISELDADFNSIVHRGQVLARLDPTAAREALDQARAKLMSAQDALEGAQVALDDGKFKLDEADTLARKAIMTQSDLEDAQVAWKQALVDLGSKRADLAEAQGEVDQAKDDLAHTIIASPIDGIVVARDVDTGQTLAARFDAPTLFEIAADLSRMEIQATIDEDDIGVLREGQPVAFSVGAYPDRTYTGTIKQVRLAADPAGSVATGVTYTAIVDVPNPDLSLRPGMTATLRVDVPQPAGPTDQHRS